MLDESPLIVWHQDFEGSDWLRPEDRHTEGDRGVSEKIEKRRGSEIGRDKLFHCSFPSKASPVEISVTLETNST